MGRERSCICWLMPQLYTVTRAEPGPCQQPGTHSKPPKQVATTQVLEAAPVLGSWDWEGSKDSNAGTLLWNAGLQCRQWIARISYAVKVVLKISFAEVAALNDIYLQVLQNRLCILGGDAVSSSTQAGRFTVSWWGVADIRFRQHHFVKKWLMSFLTNISGFFKNSWENVN